MSGAHRPVANRRKQTLKLAEGARSVADSTQPRLVAEWGQVIARGRHVMYRRSKRRFAHCTSSRYAAVATARKKR